MATLLPLQLFSQEGALVKRYASGTAATAISRQAEGGKGIFLVRFPNVPAQAVLEKWGWIKSLHPRFHIVRQLLPDSTVSAWKANDNWKASTKLLDKVFSSRGNDSITFIADATGGFPVFRQPARNVYEMRIAVKDWPKFAADTALHFADVPRKPHTESSAANADLAVNRVNALHAENPLLQGAGMRISLKETLYDTLDIDLRSRHIRRGGEPGTTGHHATLMATLMAGNGNSGPGGKGAAPLAMIASSDFARLLPDEDEEFTSFNIHAQNHSYGTGIENYYGLEAVAYDAQVREMDTFLHVFSSGNIGGDAPADGVYSGLTGFANLSGSFKHAKNVLVAGATDAFDAVATLSSKGPAFDGRLKPELVAYGAGGTSDAAALVSGIGLLMQERYRLQTGTAPPVALIIAVLLNSARDVGTPGPDYAAGFGAADAREAVNTIVGRRYFAGIASQGSVSDYPVTVPAGAGTLKATLRYNDVEAPANSARALVNDLDLWVTDASGHRFDPQTLSAFPHRDSLARAAVPGRDSLNNTEQVLARSSAGGFTIHVKGYKVSGDQPFSIAWQWVPDNHFAWAAPAGAETLGAAEQTVLRWNTNITGPGRIFVRAGASGNWQRVTDVTDVSGSPAAWKTPAAFGAMQLRMDVSGKTFEGPEFLVAPRLQPRTGFICEDSALIWWPAATGAARYRIYALSGNAYQLLQETADTVFAFRPSAIASGILAVSAVAGFEGPRSPAHLFAANYPGCFIRNFTADLDAAGAVQLRLELGTPAGVKSIRWFRQGVLLKGASAGNGFVYAGTDDRPPQGIVYYYAEVELDNGRIVRSDAVAVAVTGAAEYLLFPNPAGEWIRLLAKGLRGQRIVVADMQGRVRKTIVLENLLQEIPLNGLPAGQYRIAIYENEKRTFGAHFIKLR